MSNLFSVFDPSSGWLSLSLNWLSSLVVFAFPLSFWLLGSKSQVLLKKGLTTLAGEIALVNKLGFPNSSLLFLTSFFLLIVMNNFFGLMPYVFTSTSHLSFTLPLAVSAWLGVNLWAGAKNFSSFLAHLVPMGTPKALVPFMVCIEVVSSVMRPFTLAIRLAANMIAGHLLLVLVSSPMVAMGLVGYLGVLIALLSLAVLELAVAAIQSYVFMSLLSLYTSEVHKENL